jgi:hypothetical protein
MYANPQTAPMPSETALCFIHNPRTLGRPSLMPVLDDQLVNLSQASYEIGNAWAQYTQSTVKRYRDGLDFGGVCREWQAAFRAQGSRTGQGFENTLERLNIPKTTAYRWIKRYEIKMRLRTAWNEVACKRSSKPGSPEATSNPKKRFALQLKLTRAEKKRLDEDIELLGGPTKVAELFLEYLSEKVSKKKGAANERSNGVEHGKL